MDGKVKLTRTYLQRLQNNKELFSIRELYSQDIQYYETYHLLF